MTLFTSGRPTLERLAPYALGVLLVATPLAAANVLHGGPLLPTGNAGWEPWLVNNERATGSWFPATAADDYPFRGLAESEVAPEVQAAQRKLALQYVAMNPAQLLPALWLRLRLNWKSDLRGLDWTVDRAPRYWSERLPLVDRLPGLTQRAYSGLLALALVGATRYATRSGVWGALVLPLGYIVAIYGLAEANSRYQTTALPLLCALAGAALAPGPGWGRLWPILGLALGWWAGEQPEAPTWLILATVAAPQCSS